MNVRFGIYFLVMVVVSFFLVVTILMMKEQMEKISVKLSEQFRKDLFLKALR